MADSDTKKAAGTAGVPNNAPGKPVAPLPPSAGTTILGFSLPQVVGLIGMVAGAVVPGGQVLGLSIDAITKIGLGVANEVPDAIAAFHEIQAVANSGLPPTPEQWAAWNDAADAAHAAAQAAADKVISGSGS